MEWSKPVSWLRIKRSAQVKKSIALRKEKGCLAKARRSSLPEQRARKLENHGQALRKPPSLQRKRKKPVGRPPAKGRKPAAKPKRRGRPPAAKKAAGTRAKKPAAKRSPGRPRKTASAASKKSRPLDVALELGKSASGFTIYDLAAARGTSQIGPFKRTVNKGVRDGVLKIIGQDKAGRDLYVATGTAAKAPAVKKGPGRGRKKAAPKAAPKTTKKAAAKKAISAADLSAVGSGDVKALARLFQSIADVLNG